MCIPTYNAIAITTMATITGVRYFIPVPRGDGREASDATLIFAVSPTTTFAGQAQKSRLTFWCELQCFNAAGLGAKAKKAASAQATATNRRARCLNGYRMAANHLRIARCCSQRSIHSMPGKRIGKVNLRNRISHFSNKNPASSQGGPNSLLLYQ